MTGPTVQSRKTLRKAVAGFLTTELGSTVQAVYPFQKKQLDNQSPVIVIHSASADRTTASNQLLLTGSYLYLSVHIFARYQDLQATPPWTEEDSEDQMDDLEQKITSWVLREGDNNDGLDSTKPWLTLATSGASDITRALFEGIDYRHEEILLVAEVNNIE